MEIRTITAGAREEDIGRAARAAQLARERLTAAGYTVQTLRLALSASGFNSCADFATVAQGAEAQALDAGFDYVTLGPLEAERLEQLPEAIAATETVFASAAIAGLDRRVNSATLLGAATAITRIAAMIEGGFGNLRFAAAANVAPGSPFFPAGYHDGSTPWIAIGPEAAALAVAATTGDTETGRHGDTETGKSATVAQSSSPPLLVSLSKLIEHHDAAMRAALHDVGAETGVRFAGCDWSLAPHPDPARSIGAAIEAISGVPFGAWGTLAAVRRLTEAVRAANVTQLGFSGIMLPVLEDATLARRNAEGRYTLRDLLAFSSVCGTGLDTIPLPGDTTAIQLAGVLHEVAALATALHKPLTARFLPIPGLKAGDLTTFDFPYFVNTRVMSIGSGAASPLLV